MLLRSNFSSFPQYFQYISTGVKLHIHLLNVVVRFIVFLTSAALIFRGTDISKCFRGSLGIRDNESRLYFNSEDYKQYVLPVMALSESLRCPFFSSSSCLYSLWFLNYTNIEYSDGCVNCVLLIAVLFRFCYERDFKLSLPYECYRSI